MKKTPKRECVSLNIRSLSEGVRAQFKAYCARRGYSMERAVIALMKKATRNDMTLEHARRGTRKRNKRL